MAVETVGSLSQATFIRTSPFRSYEADEWLYWIMSQVNLFPDRKRNADMIQPIVNTVTKKLKGFEWPIEILRPRGDGEHKAGDPYLFSPEAVHTKGFSKPKGYAETGEIPTDDVEISMAATDSPEGVKYLTRFMESKDYVQRQEIARDLSAATQVNANKIEALSPLVDTSGTTFTVDPAVAGQAAWVSTVIDNLTTKRWTIPQHRREVRRHRQRHSAIIPVAFCGHDVYDQVEDEMDAKTDKTVDLRSFFRLDSRVDDMKKGEMNPISDSEIPGLMVKGVLYIADDRWDQAQPTTILFPELTAMFLFAHAAQNPKSMGPKDVSLEAAIDATRFLVKRQVFMVDYARWRHMKVKNTKIA